MAPEPMTYEQVRDAASKLEPEEQLRLLASLATLVRQRIAPGGQRSVMELEGLGREAWRDPRTGELIDAQEYVNRERDSWRG